MAASRLEPSSNAPFPTTRWSRVARAGDDARAALAELCAAYWYPIYAMIRRMGYADALDLTQGYFARLLEKPVIAAGLREEVAATLRDAGDEAIAEELRALFAVLGG